MRRIGICLLLAIGPFLALGCGLDGVSGQLIRLDGNQYTIMTPSGRQMIIQVDRHTRTDHVKEGDYIHAYVTKKGYAEFLQKIER
jgi:hypothetical protein